MQGNVPLFPPTRDDAGGPSSLDLLGMLYRQAGLIIVCTALVGALGLLIYKQQSPSYVSKARVWIQTDQQGSPSFLSGIAAYRDALVPDPVNRKIETEMELFQSRSSAAAVVRKLGITRDQLARSPVAGLKAQVRSWLAPFLPDKPATPGGYQPPVDQFMDGIAVAPLRSKTAETSSNVLEVSFECADPALAPVALGALLENYINLGARQNQRLGEATSQLISDKLNQARDELRGVEDQIAAVTLRESGRANSPILMTDRAAGDANTPNTSLDVGGLKLDAGQETLRVGNAQSLSILKAQTLEMQARLDELSQLYTDNSEYVRGMRDRIADARKRLVEGVKAGVQAETELGRLERQRAIAQDRYVELQKKLDQIDLYLRLNPTESESRVIVDPPYQPDAADGKKKPIVAALGPVAGLLLGLLLGGVRELFDRRLRGAREVEQQLGLPLLGAIPRLSGTDAQRLAGTRA
jgi:uncharacterized protein involved in exopolysaccharide biosynthesis